MHGFMFATGIENSYPTIAGGVRVDQMAKCGHAVALEGVELHAPAAAGRVPIVGFTWYSLTDQIDWDVALRVEHNRTHPVGLYDHERRVRPVGAEYRRLIREWRDFLPAGSSALMLV